MLVIHFWKGGVGMASEEDRRAILKLGESWGEAMRGRDIARLLSLVTDDVIFMPANMPSVEGKKAVAAMFRDFFDNFSVDQEFAPEEIQVGGDWAFIRGQDAMTLRPKQGPAIRVEARGISIAQRGEDGVWRFARGITNSR
jgi:uncharacterized protein (TIGR02246 family)